MPPVCPGQSQQANQVSRRGFSKVLFAAIAVVSSRLNSAFMSKSLSEYIAWLDEQNRIWPKPPPCKPVRAKPTMVRLPGIRAVSWSLYGTLLRISDGRFQFQPPEPLRMQVALEKTIDEFKMWHSMTRKPGAPWEAMLQQYTTLVEEQAMKPAAHAGDTPEIDAVAIWRKVIERLGKKEYHYDRSVYGDEDALAAKIAYFFHASLQGVEAAETAVRTLKVLANAGLAQGVIADGQTFTLYQLLRALRQQDTLPSLDVIFDRRCLVFSCLIGARKPSPSLFQSGLQRFRELGIAPGEIVHVGSRQRDDLAIAKRLGMRTILYAGDQLSLQATQADLNDPDVKPDRMITRLDQLCGILSAK